MQNPILKFRQSSYITKNSVYLSEKLKTLTSSTTTVEFNIFLLKFYTPFRLTNVYKSEACVGFFKILFRSWVIAKPGFHECVETRYFLILANNSGSKLNKKNPTHAFVDIGEKGTCAKFQLKLLKSMVVWVRQIFQFFRQNTWFPENNRALSKFCIGFSIT